MTPIIYANYGFRMGDKDSQARIDLFVEKAILLPEQVAVSADARADLPPLLPLVRVSLWYCDDNRRYFMTEPDGDPAVMAAHLNEWGLPWLRVPSAYGPHGGDATTFLFVSPKDEDALREVGQRLGMPLRAL